MWLSVTAAGKPAGYCNIQMRRISFSFVSDGWTFTKHRSSWFSRRESMDHLRERELKHVETLNVTSWASGWFVLLSFYSFSEFSGADGSLAALWLICWAMWLRAASHGWTRKSSEACLGQNRTRTRITIHTTNLNRTKTGPGAARKAWPRWLSPLGLIPEPLSWMTAADLHMVGNSWSWLWIDIRWEGSVWSWK